MVYNQNIRFLKLIWINGISMFELATAWEFFQHNFVFGRFLKSTLIGLQINYESSPIFKVFKLYEIPFPVFNQCVNFQHKTLELKSPKT